LPAHWLPDAPAAVTFVHEVYELLFFYYICPTNAQCVLTVICCLFCKVKLLINKMETFIKVVVTMFI